MPQFCCIGTGIRLRLPYRLSLIHIFQPLVYRLVCSNGMVVNDAQTRRTHIGRVNEADENFQLFSQETLAADDHAFDMKIKDTVMAAVDETLSLIHISVMTSGCTSK